MINERIARRIVELMNEALESDPAAVRQLCDFRTPCNDALSAHQSIQVGDPGKIYGCNTVGLLGILNGVAGANDEDHWGAVTAICEEDGSISAFEILEDRLQRGPGVDE